MNVVSNSPISICILDTGINNGHPLLAPILSDRDKHAINSEWGTSDHNGHGTLMAGLAAFGDLQHCLESSDEIVISHILESSKILPPPPNSNAPELWGDITSQAIRYAYHSDKENKPREERSEEVQAIAKMYGICLEDGRLYQVCLMENLMQQNSMIGFNK